MCRRIFIAPFAAALAMAMTGCYTLSIVNFGNGTTATVTVKSSQTGEEIAVKSGSFRKLPHAAGDIIVTVHSGEKLKFPGVEPPTLDVANASYLAKRNCLFGPGKVTLSLRLETNFQLYVLMPGGKSVDPKTQQPNGYPKAAQKTPLR